MKIKIIRIDKSLPMPEYQTKGSVAFDLYARAHTIIKTKQFNLIPLNVVIETPPGYMLTIVPRSSLPKKTGLLYPHGIGVIDNDYCGKDDELMLQVYNPTNFDVIINRKDRIAQAILVRIAKVGFEEVDIINDKSRGGFGSTN